MRKWFAALLTCVLMGGTLSFAFASETTGVWQKEDGHYNVFMSNGYFAYDIQHGWKTGKTGDTYAVVPTLQMITTNIANGTEADAKQCSRILKYLFVDYYDKMFEDRIKTQYAVWWPAAGLSNWKNGELIEKVNQDIKDGKVTTYPDSGASKVIDANTTAFFDFIGLIADKDDRYPQNSTDQVNNLFGYRLRFEVTGKAGDAIRLNAPGTMYDNSNACKWQVKRGGSYVDIENAAGASYTIPSLAASHNGAQYRLIVNADTGAYFDYKVIVEGAGLPSGAGGTQAPPQTGDGANIALWIGMLMASGICAAVFGRKARKEY